MITGCDEISIAISEMFDTPTPGRASGRSNFDWVASTAMQGLDAI